MLVLFPQIKNVVREKALSGIWAFKCDFDNLMSHLIEYILETMNFRNLKLRGKFSDTEILISKISEAMLIVR